MPVQNLSALAKEVWPWLLPSVREMIAASGVSAGAGGSSAPNAGGSLVAHGLNSAFHTGALSDVQAPQFLKTNGTRALTGNMAVAVGITIDGVDISAHAADPDAHHDTASAGDGLEVTGQHFAIDLAANPGLEFSSGDLRVKVNSTLERVSDAVGVNQAHSFTWTGSHTFNIGVVTFNTDPQVGANLDFIGATDRYITAASHLRIEPTGDLWLNPASDLIQANNDTEWRSQTIGDAPTGISGWRLWDRGGNESQLTITAIKADELFVRFFTADETRIHRGESFWSKSFGIVETTFVVPADEATVDVWFEAVAALPGFDIFEVGDWLLCRTIDLDGGGLQVQKIWWTVDSKLADDTTAEGMERQQWRIKRESGGTTGMEIKASNVFLDAGVPTNTVPGQLGQGVVHISALDEDSGPFIQVGNFDSVLSDVPQFLYRTRMGNLKGTVDYGSDNVFGFATGNNLGVTPSGGFSGMASEAENGLRLFNVQIDLYDDATRVVGISQNEGIRLVNDTDLQDNAYTSISWHNDLSSLTGPSTVMTSYDGGSGNLTFDITTTSDIAQGTIALIASGAGGSSVLSLSSNGVLITSSAEITLDPGGSSGIRAFAQLFPHADITHDLGTASLRWRSLYVDDIYAETISGTSISGAEWEHSGSMIINASGAGDLLVSVTNQGGGRADLDVDRDITLGGTIDGIDLSIFYLNYISHIGNASAHHAPVTEGDGIDITGQSVAVDTTVVRTSRNLIAGNGLTGGGTLASDRTFNVGAGDGIAVAADSVAVSLAASSGLTFSSSALTLGTPSTLTASTTNALSGSNHSHAVSSSSDVGTSPAAALLKSTAGGGLTLGTLAVKGSVDITNAGNLYVAGSIGGAYGILITVDDRVGFGRTPDPQFTVDVNGPLRADYLIGKHAIQLEGALLLAHWDGGEPYSSNNTGEKNGHKGQDATLVGGVTFRPGKFGKALNLGETKTNYCTNPSFEVDLTGWSNFNGGTWTRVTTDAMYGSACMKSVTAGSSQSQSISVSGLTNGAYVVSGWIKRETLTGISRFYASTSAFGSPTYSSNVSAGGWTRVSVPFTVSDGTCRIVPTGDAGTTYWDGFQIEQSHLTPYLDGDQDDGPGLVSGSHSWSGTAHASSSSRSDSHLYYSTANNIRADRGTIMAWVKPDSFDDYMGILDAGSTWPNFTFYLNVTSGRPLLIWGGGSNFVQGPGIPGAEEWIHVACTWDIYSGEAYCYTNGQSSALGAFTTTAPTLASVMRVGYIAGLAGRPFNGQIDDLVILDRVAEPDEIMAVYESDAPVFAESSAFTFRSTPTGLVNADENGLWMRDVNGDAVMGMYGGEAATYSWGGKTLAKGDILFGRYGASDGGWMLFDRDGVSSKPFLSLGYADQTTFAFDSGGATMNGVLDISASGGIYQGTGTFASPTTGLKIWNQSGFGRIAGFEGGVNHWNVSTSGKLVAGGGNVILDNSGLTIAANTNGLAIEVFPQTNSVLWQRSSTVIAGINAQYASSFNTNFLNLTAQGEVVGRSGVVLLNAIDYLSGGASVEIRSDGTISLIGTVSSGPATHGQNSATGAVPTLILQQYDLSEEFIQFETTVGASNPISTAVLGSYYGKVRVSVNGTFKWMAVYN